MSDHIENTLDVRFARLESQIDRFVEHTDTAISSLRAAQESDRSVVKRLLEVVEELKLINAARWPFREVLWAVGVSLTIFSGILAGANWWLHASVSPVQATLQSSIDKLDETNRRQWTYVEKTRKASEVNRLGILKLQGVVERNAAFRERAERRAEQGFWSTTVGQ